MNYVSSKSGLCIVYESETYFKVEKIPKNLGFFERLSFVKICTESIEGFILKTYHLSNYVICVYTKHKTKLKSFCSILLEKVIFFLGVINENAQSEVWIIKEQFSYLCFGIFNNVPVFFKAFNNLNDINHNISEICEQMNSYTDIDCIRLFGIESSAIDTEMNIYEYSEEFICDRLDGCRHVNEYCVEKYAARMRQYRSQLYLLIFNIVINIVSFGMLATNCQIQKIIQILESKTILKSGYK